MDSSDVAQLLSLLILLMLSAFFSSAETALTTVNKIRMKNLADEGDKRAQLVLKITDNQGKMLSAILIGNNIVNLSASALMTVFVMGLFGNTFVGVGTGVLTLLILIFGEITPKTMATIHSEKIALSYAKAIDALMKILTPVIFVVSNLSILILKIMRVDPNAKAETMTEGELRTIVDVSHEEGVIESDERQLIHNVFDFGDSQAKDVMVPRSHMTFIDVESTYEELIELFKEYMHTRFPVYEEDTDNVIGIINIKDLLLKSPEEEFSIRNYLREAHFTYEFKSTSELMLEMRVNSINISIVLDEYGSVAGLITLEDLLEEIVGEIRDEYDEDEKDSIQKINETEYLIEGFSKLDDINDLLHLDLESEDYDSIGGLMIELLDHLPEEKEEAETENGIRLVVEEVVQNRIEWIRAYLPEDFYKEKEEVPEEEE